MNKLLLTILLFSIASVALAQKMFVSKSSFNIADAVIVVDSAEPLLIKKAAALLQQDVEAVTGKVIAIANTIIGGKNVILIGTIAQSAFIRELVKQKRLNVASVQNKWEGYLLQYVSSPFKGVGHALVIAGSDRRGAAFGVFELSKQMGVSPWYWWAEVPVVKYKDLFVNTTLKWADTPAVKYRGIFLNDEAPALSGWSKEMFGGFNHLFYEKVFELMLRLKANYIWPAMWGNAFYDDDSLNIRTADEYGIVIGTSHHEPLMRAHDEWRRYGMGLWNYDSNEARLKAFWQQGMQRAWNEKIVSVGMRGDGDEPMSRETATALLERIVKDQRQIIENVTGEPANETPQLWALYKEVQDYYDKGMRVPDDVTLLLCDDNWGNIRKLPRLDEPKRKGGYGIYYHFDYVGGPRNYKWLNTNPLPRVWEQMHLAWEYNARQIWIVNVGDLKPMELPISFFLDYAWNPAKISADNIQAYRQNWAAQQFGNTYAKSIGEMLAAYTRYNGRRKPELLNENTYSLNHYHEFENVVRKYNNLLIDAERLNEALPPQYHDAFFQLVLHPIKACANLNEMYFYVALNKEAYKKRQAIANDYANHAKQLFINDSIITLQYHQLNHGKWNHMMSQTHIGYTNWQQPPYNKMPVVHYIPKDSAMPETLAVDSAQDIPVNLLPKQFSGKIFYESRKVVSMEAAHFSKAVNTHGLQWKVLPDLGRTGDAVAIFPVTAKEQRPGETGPHLQYEVYTESEGDCKLYAYCSPTLNFHNTATGLRYAVSVDDEVPQIISLNSEDKNSISGIWNSWVANNIIIKSSVHHISKPGKHVVKFWMVDPGVVLQKIALDFGGMQSSYLGPPETLITK